LTDHIITAANKQGSHPGLDLPGLFFVLDRVGIKTLAEASFCRTAN